jgi:uncharacterized protein YegP (UPF0339 family)
MKIKFRFRILKSEAKQPYHFVCLAPNSQVIFTSENYKQKASAKNCINSIVKYMVKGVSSIEDCTKEKKNG